MRRVLRGLGRVVVRVAQVVSAVLVGLDGRLPLPASTTAPPEELRP